MFINKFTLIYPVIAMVSWSRAFFLALKALVYAILWYILGFILIGAGVSLSGFRLTPLTPYGIRRPSFSSGFTAIIGIILIIIGTIIIIFGTTASLIKVAVDEAEPRRPPYAPPLPRY